MRSLFDYSANIFIQRNFSFIILLLTYKFSLFVSPLHNIRSHSFIGCLDLDWASICIFIIFSFSCLQPKAKQRSLFVLSQYSFSHFLLISSCAFVVIGRCTFLFVVLLLYVFILLLLLIYKKQFSREILYENNFVYKILIHVCILSVYSVYLFEIVWVFFYRVVYFAAVASIVKTARLQLYHTKILLICYNIIHSLNVQCDAFLISRFNLIL